MSRQGRNIGKKTKYNQRPDRDEISVKKTKYNQRPDKNEISAENKIQSTSRQGRNIGRKQNTINVPTGTK